MEHPCPGIRALLGTGFTPGFFPYSLCSLKFGCFTNHNGWSVMIFKYLSGPCVSLDIGVVVLCTVYVSVCDVSLCANSDIWPCSLVL